MVGLGVTSLVFTSVSTVAAFVVFQRELEARQVQFLAQYVQERTTNVDRRFSELIGLHRSAISALGRNVAAMGPRQAAELIAQETVARPDGTRRSRPELFDGYMGPGGARTYGLGAFIAHGDQVSPDEQRVLAAAFPIVSDFGQAAHGSYDNFYFFTPRNRLIIFGPDRPDRLMFYRQSAPADLDVSHEEMSRFITPAADPSGQTRCTSLQRLIQDNHQTQRVQTACVTPAYVQGRYVGAFGSSIKLDSFLASVVNDSLPDAENLIVRGDGQLIAAPRAPLSVTRNEAAVAAYERKLGLTQLIHTLDARKDASGVVRSAHGGHIIAYGRLAAPNWYLLLSYPAGAVTWSAVRSASWVLLLGLMASALQAAVVLRLARSTIVRPLQTLALSCRSRDHDDSGGLAQRGDEIGLLARSLHAERARADQAMATLERRVQERTAELERANDEKSRFLANMSHELRTPLNGVIALSETLVREQTTPRNVELAELIVASGRLLEQVLTDILDFSKIEAGEMRIEARPFDLQTVVAQVSELHRASAAAKGITLSWRLQPEAAGGFMGDSVRLTQVLSNLLSNAVKFTEHGEVALSVERAADGLRFRVRDTGVGFDEEVRARLFQRFEQADVSIRRRFGGTGLGLAICRSLVQLMGGRIEARSTPGVGSVFTFDLPLAAAVAAPKPVAAAPETHAESALDRVRILLAEDHPTNQKVVRLILEAVGVDLHIVENGLEALDALEQQRYDLVLMDMQMPELDGLSATAMLRERELAGGLVRTPVIMLTANALDEHVRASFQAGADRHLSKPLRAAELLDAIDRLVSEPAPDPAAEVGAAA